MSKIFDRLVNSSLILFYAVFILVFGYIGYSIFNYAISIKYTFRGTDSEIVNRTIKNVIVGNVTDNNVFKIKDSEIRVLILKKPAIIKLENSNVRTILIDYDETSYYGVVDNKNEKFKVNTPSEINYSNSSIYNIDTTSNVIINNLDNKEATIKNINSNNRDIVIVSTNTKYETFSKSDQITMNSNVEQESIEVVKTNIKYHNSIKNLNIKLSEDKQYIYTNWDLDETHKAGYEVNVYINDKLLVGALTYENSYVYDTNNLEENEKIHFEVRAKTALDSFNNVIKPISYSKTEEYQMKGKKDISKISNDRIVNFEIIKKEDQNTNKIKWDDNSFLSSKYEVLLSNINSEEIKYETSEKSFTVPYNDIFNGYKYVRIKRLENGFWFLKNKETAFSNVLTLDNLYLEKQDKHDIVKNLFISQGEYENSINVSFEKNATAIEYEIVIKKNNSQILALNTTEANNSYKLEGLNNGDKIEVLVKAIRDNFNNKVYNDSEYVSSNILDYKKTGKVEKIITKNFPVLKLNLEEVYENNPKKIYFDRVYEAYNGYRINIYFNNKLEISETIFENEFVIPTYLLSKGTKIYYEIQIIESKQGNILYKESPIYKSNIEVVREEGKFVKKAILPTNINYPTEILEKNDLNIYFNHSSSFDFYEVTYYINERLIKSEKISNSKYTIDSKNYKKGDRVTFKIQTISIDNSNANEIRSEEFVSTNIIISEKKEIEIVKRENTPVTSQNLNLKDKNINVNFAKEVNAKQYKLILYINNKVEEEITTELNSYTFKDKKLNDNDVIKVGIITLANKVNYIEYSNSKEVVTNEAIYISNIVKAEQPIATNLLINLKENNLDLSFSKIASGSTYKINLYVNNKILKTLNITSDNFKFSSLKLKHNDVIKVGIITLSNKIDDIEYSESKETFSNEAIYIVNNIKVEQPAITTAILNLDDKNLSFSFIKVQTATNYRLTTYINNKSIKTATIASNMYHASSLNIKDGDIVKIGIVAIGITTSGIEYIDSKETFSNEVMYFEIKDTPKQVQSTVTNQSISLSGKNLNLEFFPISTAIDYNVKLYINGSVVRNETLTAGAPFYNLNLKNNDKIKVGIITNSNRIGNIDYSQSREIFTNEVTYNEEVKIVKTQQNPVSNQSINLSGKNLDFGFSLVSTAINYNVKLYVNGVVIKNETLTGGTTFSNLNLKNNDRLKVGIITNSNKINNIEYSQSREIFTNEVTYNEEVKVITTQQTTVSNQSINLSGKNLNLSFNTVATASSYRVYLYINNITIKTESLTSGTTFSNLNLKNNDRIKIGIITNYNKIGNIEYTTSREIFTNEVTYNDTGKNIEINLRNILSQATTTGCYLDFAGESKYLKISQSSKNIFYEEGKGFNICNAFFFDSTANLTVNYITNTRNGSTYYNALSEIINVNKATVSVNHQDDFDNIIISSSTIFDKAIVDNIEYGHRDHYSLKIPKSNISTENLNITVKYRMISFPNIYYSPTYNLVLSNEFSEKTAIQRKGTTIEYFGERDSEVRKLENSIFSLPLPLFKKVFEENKNVYSSIRQTKLEFYNGVIIPNCPLGDGACAGIYFGNERRITTTITEWVYFHEVGHALDFQFCGYDRISSGTEFKKIYSNNSNNASIKDYYRSNILEMFAYGFQEYYQGRRDILKNSAPDLYNFFDSYGSNFPCS